MSPTSQREYMMQIESLRQQLATMTAAYADAVEKHNMTLDELAECERERDEWKERAAHESKVSFERWEHLTEQLEALRDMNKQTKP